MRFAIQFNKNSFLFLNLWLCTANVINKIHGLQTPSWHWVWTDFWKRSPHVRIENNSNWLTDWVFNATNASFLNRIANYFLSFDFVIYSIYSMHHLIIVGKVVSSFAFCTDGASDGWFQQRKCMEHTDVIARMGFLSNTEIHFSLSQREWQNVFDFFCILAFFCHQIFFYSLFGGV